MDAVILSQEEFQGLQSKVNEIHLKLCSGNLPVQENFIDNNEFLRTMNISKRTLRHSFKSTTTSLSNLQNNSVMKSLKVLPVIVHKNGFIYSQIKRTKVAAMYEQFDPRLKMVVGYEVFKVIIVDRKKIDIPEKTFKMKALKYEKFPSNSDFGKSAWTCKTIESAMEKFNSLIQIANKSS